MAYKDKGQGVNCKPLLKIYKHESVLYTDGIRKTGSLWPNTGKAYFFTIRIFYSRPICMLTIVSLLMISEGRGLKNKTKTKGKLNLPSYTDKWIQMNRCEQHLTQHLHRFYFFLRLLVKCPGFLEHRISKEQKKPATQGLQVYQCTTRYCHYSERPPTCAFS